MTCGTALIVFPEAPLGPDSYLYHRMRPPLKPTPPSPKSGDGEVIGRTRVEEWKRGAFYGTINILCPGKPAGRETSCHFPIG